MRVAYLGAAALLAITIAGAMPALADVKAGVDAWSRGDFDKAVAEWRGPAIAGDADAQFNMGQAYKLGRGVATDPAQAIEWFRKAAVRGHAQAEDNYALMLFQEGRKADALPWLEKSVTRDEKRTELVLGTMLFNGDAVKKDWVRAYALVSRSSRQGLAQASQTLAQMDQYISAEQRQKGTELASKIESDGHARRLAAASTPSHTAPLELPAAPPTKVATKAAPGASYPPPARPVEKVAHVAPKEAKPKAKEIVAATGGNWRIQLGAFRDEANARALWGKVGGKTGGRVAYAKAAGVTRLQATGFASRAAAQAACGKAGVPCVVVGQ